MSAQVVTALAHNTLRESVRNKIAYALLFFAVLMIGSGAILSALSYVEGDRILQDVGLAAIRLFGVAIAIFVGIQLVHREVERRTVYTILSKPISRGQFLLGKFAGLTLTIWLQTACMALAFTAISLAAGSPAGIVFTYQTTDPNTNQPTGNPNTPANIVAGASQTFVISLRPTQAFAPTNIQFTFQGSNTNAVTSLRCRPAKVKRSRPSCRRRFMRWRGRGSTS